MSTRKHTVWQSIKDLEGGLIVSCQASSGEPLAAPQHILALAVQHHVPEARIVGTSLPEWGIEVPLEEPVGIRARRLHGHRIPFRATIKQFARGEIDAVRISWPF